MIGLGLAIFQQVTGINAIIYFADQIFGAAGFATEASRTTVTTWAIGGVNVLSTLIAVAFIDRLGRRRLLLTGLIGMSVSLVGVGGAFEFIASPDRASSATQAFGPSDAGLLTLLGLIAFIISFAFSLGPVVWTVINEIFPGRIRGCAEQEFHGRPARAWLVENSADRKGPISFRLPPPRSPGLSRGGASGDRRR